MLRNARYMPDLVADTNAEVGEWGELCRCSEKMGGYVESTIASAAGVEGARIRQAWMQYARVAGWFECTAV